MTTDFKGITLNVWRFTDKDERMSLLYRVTDHIDEANSVMTPFINGRKTVLKEETNNFENGVTVADKSSIARVENHARAMQEYQACSWLRRALSSKPVRPSDADVATWKRVTDARAELSNRLANPLMDLLKPDGEAMLKGMMEEWAKVGFTQSANDQESNGEYVKEVIGLTFTAPVV